MEVDGFIPYCRSLYCNYEQLFYQLNITLKYFAIIPMALLFIVATNPSEFAASLNKIGVNYKIVFSGYSFKIYSRCTKRLSRNIICSTSKRN